MFSYYGTKRKLAHLYAPPLFNEIVEPFAGAAGYSLHADNWMKNVSLYDVNPKIVAVWRYLIAARDSDIRRLPDIQPGERLTDYGTLSDAERWLIGFCINPGSSMPKVTATGRSKWGTYKRRIMSDLHKVRHWTVQQKSYADIPDRTATWHIDPPYQHAGKYYFGFSALDFKRLGQWCSSRSGQVMVCENASADWLPFRYLADHRGSVQKNVEVIWTADNVGDGALGALW